MHVWLLLLQAAGTCSVCPYCTAMVQHVRWAAAGCQKKTNRANLNCAPCSVDTRLGRPAYYGRLSPAMREKRERAPLLSRLIPTASSTPAWAWAWGALAPGRLVPAPRSSGPSHTVREGRSVQTEQNRTNLVPTPSHRPRPITRPSGGALANDESDAAPN